MAGALGIPAADYAAVLEVLTSQRASTAFLEHRPLFGPLLAAHAFLKNFGTQNGASLEALLRNACCTYTGRPDITLGELYDMRGTELCCVVAAISDKEAQYWHPKTTPDIRVVDAVIASVSVPGVIQPARLLDKDGKVSPTDTFVDGGLVANFPLHAFDGWYLSMAPEDSFLNRIKPMRDIAHFLQEDVCFNGRNPHTLGFNTLDITKTDRTRKWLREGGDAPPTPQTRLARKAANARAAANTRHAARAVADETIEALVDSLRECSEDGAITRESLGTVLANGLISDAQCADLFGTTKTDAAWLEMGGHGRASLSFVEYVQLACSCVATRPAVCVGLRRGGCVA